MGSQLLTSYQNLLRMTKERLRGCQLALQEHEALEEALQDMWSQVREVQDRLACAESTLGSKETLERRLSQIQVCVSSQLLTTARKIHRGLSLC